MTTPRLPCPARPPAPRQARGQALLHWPARLAALSTALTTLLLQLLCLAWLLLPIGPAQAAGAQAAPAQCIVTRVSDGDSLQARCQHGARVQRLKLRLRAIDAPELRQPYGQAARQALLGLCLHQRVQLPARAQRDRYGRTLVDLHCGGVAVAERLVAQGLAWVHRGTARDYPRLLRLQQQAQRSGKGLWAQREPTPPWAWRHAHPQPPRRPQ
ncbi:thermonuclease family protein [Vandammella animalimorsus]|uniref:Thermonuclease family protein n=1 Tax=Vandammella animalimorsus TaxID=2029117 RepID=A0A3M6RLG4_9BURK|nr:thermonuclease family protein [Vandammella animalimorsus]RMX15634.1 thermonuclease family protein [Vandammella animalimorsus]